MSSVSAAASTTSASSTSSNAATKAINQNLGKNDFIKLMITQMQYQDPLEPMKNEQFVAQLAQFSSLEQTTNLNTTMVAFTKNTMSLQSGGMVGRKVTGLDADGNKVEGTVTGIEFADGSPVLLVGDQKLPLSGMSKLSV